LSFRDYKARTKGTSYLYSLQCSSEDKLSDFSEHEGNKEKQKPPDASKPPEQNNESKKEKENLTPEAQEGGDDEKESELSEEEEIIAVFKEKYWRESHGTSAQYEARLFGLKKDWVKNWEEKAAEKKAGEQQAKENETDGKAVEDKASGVGKGVKCTGAEETTLAGKGLEGKALDATRKRLRGRG